MTPTPTSPHLPSPTSPATRSRGRRGGSGWLGLLLAAAAWVHLPAGAADPRFQVRQGEDRLEITCDAQPVADYVWRDPKILRPHFANVHGPGGERLTRRHPPVPGVDATDHDTMHPGVWLAFGDVNGHDFWRNRGRIEHVRFLEPPRTEDGIVTFATENLLQPAQGPAIGTQITRVRLTSIPHGFLLVWQADFLPREEALVFGDQEEMGLGVRVATDLTEKNGGRIIASTGTRSARSTWGQSFPWCDASGERAGRRVGVTLLSDPAHFRPSWFHNRDYGLMVANPFGRKSMNQGEVSRVPVGRGERLRLRFGVFLHAATPPEQADPAEAYRRFLATAAAE